LENCHILDISHSAKDIMRYPHWQHCKDFWHFKSTKLQISI